MSRPWLECHCTDFGAHEEDEAAKRVRVDKGGRELPVPDELRELGRWDTRQRAQSGR